MKVKSSCIDRSENMRRIRSKDTKPEMTVRRLLHSLGLRFRIHCLSLPGKPDIVLKKYNAVVFVNGCFWHQHESCSRSNLPKTNSEYWNPKLTRNVERDKETYCALNELGWQVLVVWECELQDMIRLKERLEGVFNVRR